MLKYLPLLQNYFDKTHTAESNFIYFTLYETLITAITFKTADSFDSQFNLIQF